MKYFILALTLGLSLVAQAVSPPPPADTTPPDFSNTKIVGEKIKAGEKNLEGWEIQLLGDMANYNAYTMSKDDQKLVVEYTKNCKNKNGKKTFKCNFTVPGTGADLLASSLLGAKAYETKEQRQAALDFVKNMTNMSGLGYPGDKAVFKNPDDKSKGLTDEGIAYLAGVFKQLPILTIAQNSMLALFADRERLPGFSKGLPNTVGKNGEASLLEMLDYEASRRYTNPAWFSAMDNASNSATHHEIAYMLAFQNYLMVKQYEQNARIEALLVAQLSNMTNLTSAMDLEGLGLDEEFDADEYSDYDEE